MAVPSTTIVDPTRHHLLLQRTGYKRNLSWSVLSSRNAVSNEPNTPLASATAAGGTGERKGLMMTRQLQCMRSVSSDEELYDASIKPSPPQLLSASNNQSSSNNDNVIIAVHDPNSRRFIDYSNNNTDNTSAAATAGQLLVDWGDHASGGGSSSSLDTASARTSTSEEQQLAEREPAFLRSRLGCNCRRQ